jgi:Family of unknown function (DUF6790)
MARRGLLWSRHSPFGPCSSLTGLRTTLGGRAAAASSSSWDGPRLAWALRGSCLWFGIPYVIGPCAAGAILYLGAAIGHARDVAKRGNLRPGNAGPVFYINILAPAVTILAILMAHPWRTAA